MNLPRGKERTDLGKGEGGEMTMGRVGGRTHLGVRRDVGIPARFDGRNGLLGAALLQGGNMPVRRGGSEQERERERERER